MTLQECIDHTIEQRDKFAALPDHAINLDVFMDWNARTYADANGCVAPSQKHTSCNSAGCVHGWVEHDLRTRGIAMSPSAYLARPEFVTPASFNLFGVRMRYDITEREEGLERFNARLAELYALQVGAAAQVTI